MQFDDYGKTAYFRVPVPYEQVFPNRLMPALAQLMIQPHQIFHMALLVREECSYGCNAGTPGFMRNMMVEQFWNDLADEVESAVDYRDLLQQHLPVVGPIFDRVLQLVDTYFPVSQSPDVQAPSFLDAQVTARKDSMVVELSWNDEY